jgi:hypothetical protein
MLTIFVKTGDNMQGQAYLADTEIITAVSDHDAMFPYVKE